MEVVRDKKTNRTLVTNTTKSGLGFQYSVPGAGAEGGQFLRIRKGKSTIKLTNSQIQALSRVISRGKRYVQ